MEAFFWILITIAFVIIIVVVQKFKKTALWSNFVFLEGENVIFSDDPERLEYVRPRDRARVLKRSRMRVTNKGRIIFAQQLPRSDDERVFAVFTLEHPSGSIMNSWSQYGYPIVPLDTAQLCVKINKKQGRYVVFSGETNMMINRIVGNILATLKVYTSRIVEYEKVLDMSIPIRD